MMMFGLTSPSNLPLENVYYDYWHQFAGKRRDAVHSAVIAVDDATLIEYKDDPLAFWAPYWAQAMDVLTQAGVKAIGVVVDDTAVTPQYVQGFTPDRELPIIKKIALGSLRNKLVFILPAAMLLVGLASKAERLGRLELGDFKPLDSPVLT